MKIRSRTPVKKKKRIVLLAVLLVVALGVGTWAFLYFRDRPTEDSNGQTINLNKSDAENEREDELQSDPSKKTEGQADVPSQPAVDPSTGKQAVSVIITDAGVYDGNVEARGFVTNSVEQGGTCTYTFKKSNTDTSTTRQTSALPNSTSTTCEAAVFNVDELSTGTWSVTLEYSSTVSYGKSAAREFIVP